MPQPDEAELQPGAPPAEPQNESFSPDDDAQPAELQSPEGELPFEAEQPDAAQSADIGSSAEPQEDVEQPVEIAPFAEPQEDVSPSVAIAPSAESPEDVEQPVEIEAGEDAQLESIAPLPEPRQLSRREQEIIDRQYRRFAACGRCGYFVADCRNYLGREALQEAMLDGEDGWLRLEGDETFRRLLMYAYGIQIDVGYDVFDGVCPECRRRFVYMARGENPTRLKIQL